MSATQDDRPPTATATLLDECPRLRILVVGKSGAGKSSLISHVFGVDKASVSHNTPGTADIEEEILPAQNRLVVVHDSMGFEPGKPETFDRAEAFLRDRTEAGVELKDQIHIIWLCIQIPHAGGRVFEDGDEKFLALAQERKIPVLVVFTQYDVLIDSFRRKPQEQREPLASQKYQSVCEAALKKLNPQIPCAKTSGLSGGSAARPDLGSLRYLVKTSRDLVRGNGSGPDAAWLVYSMAQRANAKVKIEGCIALGMKGYLGRMLGSAANVPGFTLAACLETAHEEMVDSWNIYDPDTFLRKEDIKEKMKVLVQFATPSNVSDAQQWLPNIPPETSSSGSRRWLVQLLLS
ncbi:P-loop containing nucleoside triphosphate hydrolase protein [Mycena amicta]|nr:P-loop containing nucleoside triphosphate hydrolase protein [Mycena amicta]